MDKPQSVANSPFKSQKWDQITQGRNFTDKDAPVIALLCQWYEVIETCMSDLDYNGELRVAYQNDIGDIKAFPQLSTMKQASAEIRALNKQLGIDDDVTPEQTKPKETKLYVIQAKRQAKAASGG